MSKSKENPDIHKHGTRFSADYQPSPEAKSKGLRKFYARDRLKRELLEEFSKPIIQSVLLDDGSEVQKELCPHEQALNIVKRSLFSKKSDMKDKEKIEVYLKFCAFVADDTKNVSHTFNNSSNALEKMQELEQLYYNEPEE